MLTPEEALLHKIQQDQANQMSTGNAALLGSGVGALGGVLAGSVPHTAGNWINRLAGRSSSPLKGGFRMAGGLTGAILGGALGAGVQAMATRSSPAAEMLAKVQTTGTLSEPERLQLEQMLADTYSGMS